MQEQPRYGVAFTPIWSSDDDGESEFVVDVDAELVNLYPNDSQRTIGGVRCARDDGGLWQPVGGAD